MRCLQSDWWRKDIHIQLNLQLSTLSYIALSLPGPSLQNERLILTDAALKKPASSTERDTNTQSQVPDKGPPGARDRQLTPRLTYGGYFIEHLNSYPIGTRMRYSILEGSHWFLHNQCSTPHPPKHWSQAGLTSKAAHHLKPWSTPRAHSTPNTESGLAAPPHPGQKAPMSCSFCSSNLEPKEPSPQNGHSRAALHPTISLNYRISCL